MRLWRNRYSHTLLQSMQNSTTTEETMVTVFSKHLGIYFWTKQSQFQKSIPKMHWQKFDKTIHKALVAISLGIPEDWKQVKYPSVEPELNRW